jgi:hypothetical protein
MDKLKKVLILWMNEGHEKCWLSHLFHESFGVFMEFKNINQALNQNFHIPLFVVINNPAQNRLQKLINANRAFFLVNLGDEFIPTKQDHSIYDHPLCLHVFRNYYRPSDDPKKVTAFPLGYGRFFLKNISTKNIKKKALSSQRKYIWSFAGTARKSGRRKTLSRFLDFEPYFYHETSGWMAPNALSGPDYRELLLDSFVVPAPRGNCNLDCFRLYEALEAGCIPLIEKNSPLQSDEYFSNLLGPDCPILSLPDLRSPKSITFLNSIQDDISFRETTRNTIINWWDIHKRSIFKSFNSVIA